MAAHVGLCMTEWEFLQNALEKQDDYVPKESLIQKFMKGNGKKKSKNPCAMTEEVSIFTKNEVTQ